MPWELLFWAVGSIGFVTLLAWCWRNLTARGPYGSRPGRSDW